MSSRTELFHGKFRRNNSYVTQGRNLATIMVQIATLVTMLTVWTITAAKADLPLTGQAIQGGLLIGTAPMTSHVTLDGEQLETDSKGRFVIGFHRDDSQTQLLQIQNDDGSTQAHIITPEARDWDIQRIDGLAQKYVTPPAKTLARITSDRDAVQKARQPALEGTQIFETGFRWPVSGPVTGVYGSQRILNGTPRQPHYGIDIAAPKGTNVITSAPGIVTMAMDLYYTGWTVIIDHGLGLSSTYSHLDSISVKAGDTVPKDAVIGVVGSTGRSTGAHLDWRVNLGTKRLDPQIVAQVLNAAELQKAE